MSLPTASARSKLDDAITTLTEAIEAHALWTPPKPNSTLYNVWDFVKRSQYMLSEFENIQQGKALKYPDQFRPPPGTGDDAALTVFYDVCDRSTMIDLLINDTTGKTALLTGNIGLPVDFGVRCKDAVANLVRITKEVRKL